MVTTSASLRFAPVVSTLQYTEFVLTQAVKPPAAAARPLPGLPGGAQARPSAVPSIAARANAAAK